MIVRGAALLLIAAGATTMPAEVSPASAGLRSGFCRPHRDLQSFGSERSRREAGFGAHLVVAPVSVLAGHALAMRLLNVGSEEFSYGPRQTQRWVRGSWKRMPQMGYLQPVLYFLPPGAVSGCIGPITGRHWLAGKYRWRLDVKSFADGGPMVPHILRAVFRLRARR